MTARGTRRYRTAAGTPRRQPRIRRASGGLTPVRSSAILALLISAGAIFGLSTTPAFGFQQLEVEGAVLTPIDSIRGAAGIDEGTNLVGLTTEPIAARIREITSVRDVSVAVGLPGTLRLSIAERKPIVIWQVGADRYAVDEGGLLFADVSEDPDGVTAAIPTVIDDRAAAVSLGVRSTLEPVILDAATRIGSLTPSQIGSHAAALSVHVTDERGFTVSSGKGGWLAVFGFYGLSQRTPALVPGQVQLLTSLLAGREDAIATVILADAKDGTYEPKPTPKGSAKPKASAAP